MTDIVRRAAAKNIVGKRPSVDKVQKLTSRIEELERRLEEAEETLRAISAGEVDAVVVSTSSRERIYTLEGADQAYRILIEDMSEGALTTTYDGLILYCNRRFADIVNVPMEKLVGTSLLPLISPSHEDIVKSFFTTPPTDRKSVSIDFQAGNKKSVPALVSANPLPESDPPALCMVVTDLTERMKQEGRLRESEEAFRTLVESSLVGFFIFRDGNIVFSNPEQDKIFGTSNSLGPLKEIVSVHPEDRIQFEDLLNGRNPDESGYSEADIRIFPCGQADDMTSMKWVHCHAIPFRFQGEDAVLINSMDMTRSRDLEMVNATREKLISLGHVAAGIAHEIRNPLSGMNIYISSVDQILAGSAALDEKTKEIVKRSFEMALSASTKIDSIIRRVMDFARPTHAEMETVQVNQVVHQATEFSQIVMRDKGISLVLKLKEDLPDVLADTHLIEQVIMNLLNNAADAMKNQPGEKEIEIATALEDDHAVIRVSDSGPGIPQNLRSRIFEPHFTTKGGGTGLGLFFAKRVMMDHKGFIEIGTSRRGGAEFRIGIPVK